MTRLIRRRRRGFTLVELLVVILLLGASFAFLPPVRNRTCCGSNRMRCQSNLRQIGQAILLYTNDNHGAYPRALATTGSSVIPCWGTGAVRNPQPNDVSAALFLLLRTQDITSDAFICPSTNAQKDEFGGIGNTALNRSNFTDVKRNLSYSYQNPYPNDGAVNRGWKLDKDTNAEYAVASDKNPGVGSRKNVLNVNVQSSAEQMKQANSANHDGDGQNVLYGDGHVEWQQNLFVGVNRDNIFTAVGEEGRLGVSASPFDANDSILLPADN